MLLLERRRQARAIRHMPLMAALYCLLLLLRAQAAPLCLRRATFYFAAMLLISAPCLSPSRSAACHHTPV